MMSDAPETHSERRLPQWGAAVLGDGRVRFRIWAPGMEELRLRLQGSDRPMPRTNDRWFELIADGVARGAPYSFVLPDGMSVPDPAARAQAGDVHGPSLVCDPAAYLWRTQGWTGRPWEEAVLYELHIGTFTPAGTFLAAIEKLQHLADLGVTAIEVMPVAQFSGTRGWGYDGVLLYAPHNAYGTPDDLRAFVDAAHELSLMVLLDVVYNHFGPDGNYLPLLAPQFFDPDRSTPWGSAIAYEQQPVRSFFIDNAVYWLDEFRFDGLRFDAVDHIRDPKSETELLIDIARTVRERFPDRHIHLTTEDNRNVTHLHERAASKATHYTGEWNDDFHNAAHVAATGEVDGYYEDFADSPSSKLAKALAEGFAYQGEPAPHFDGQPRGAPSAHLTPTIFIDFLQNHDQIGNRALGERLRTLSDDAVLRVLTATLLLSPHIPFLFMGEEWGETQPFNFFTDFHGDLADAMRKGRKLEFAKFSAFSSDKLRERIPDPNSELTFEASKIDWDKRHTDDGAEWLAFTRGLLALRREWIAPLLSLAGGNAGRIVPSADGVIAVDWTLGDSRLELRANLTAESMETTPHTGAVIHLQPDTAKLAGGTLPGRSIVVAIAKTDAAAR